MLTCCLLFACLSVLPRLHTLFTYVEYLDIQTDVDTWAAINR